MENLKLEEIKQYLPVEQIEQILTDILVHPHAEEVLEKLPEHKSWIDDKRIYICSSPKEFTNINFAYYLNKLKILKPKILTLRTTGLTDISGLEQIHSLEEVYLGNKLTREDYAYLPSFKNISGLLEVVCKVRNIKKFGFECNYAGNFEGQELASQTLEFIMKQFPNATGRMLDYCTSFVIELNPKSSDQLLNEDNSVLDHIKT